MYNYYLLELIMQAKSTGLEHYPIPHVLKDAQEYGTYYLKLPLFLDFEGSIGDFELVASTLTEDSRRTPFQLFENYEKLLRHEQREQQWSSPRFNFALVQLTKKELQDAYAYRGGSRISDPDVILRNPVRFKAHMIISVNPFGYFKNPGYSDSLVQENNIVPHRPELPQLAMAFSKYHMQNVEAVKYLSCIDLANLVSVSHYCQNLVDSRLQQGFTVYPVITMANNKLLSLDFEALKQHFVTDILKNPFIFYTSYEEGRKSITNSHGFSPVLVSMKAFFPRPYRLLKESKQVEVRCAFPIESKDLYSYAHKQGSEEWEEVYNQPSAIATDGSASVIECKAEVPSQGHSNEHEWLQIPPNSPRITTSSSGFFRAAQQEVIPLTNNANDKSGCHYPYFE